MSLARAMKAWRVTITTWPDLKLVAVATTSGKARYQAKLDSDDAGYRIPYTNFRAKRLKSLDHLATGTPRLLKTTEFELA